MRRFWKPLVTCLLVVSSFALSSVAFAAPPADVDVGLTSSVTADGSIRLEATTLKHGSSVAVEWTSSGGTLVNQQTVLNSDGYYVSTVDFVPSSSGSYSIQYSIQMGAGSSSVEWEGSAAANVTYNLDVNQDHRFTIEIDGV